MKGVGSALSVVGFLVGTAACNTMCMYTLPEEDVFDETVWECDEVPLGPLGVSELIVSFLSEGSVAVDMRLRALDSGEVPVMSLIGHYEHNGGTAILERLCLKVDGYDVTFIEAYYNDDDVLFLLWQVDDILYPFTTVMHRQYD